MALVFVSVLQSYIWTVLSEHISLMRKEQESSARTMASIDGKTKDAMNKARINRFTGRNSFSALYLDSGKPSIMCGLQ